VRSRWLDIWRAVLCKMSVFWDDVPCNPVETAPAFRIAYCLCRQGEAPTQYAAQHPRDTHILTRHRENQASYHGLKLQVLQKTDSFFFTS
jgi:hypothetical protein